MTGKVSDSGDSYIYTYNLQNRLQTATITRTEGTSLVDITSAYVYNQSGIRVGASTSTKIDGGPAETKNTTYLVDPANFTGYGQVLEQFDDGTLAKSYTLGDDVLAQTASGTTSYLQYDGHGSTRLLTSATSAIAGKFDYDAYGKNLFSANVTNPASTDMLYSGEQFDPNLQMQYLRARYYDQNNGTFASADSYGGSQYDPQSYNRYIYGHNDPVFNNDPLGLYSLPQVLVGVSIGAMILGIIAPSLSTSLRSAYLTAGKHLPDAVLFGTGGALPAKYLTSLLSALNVPGASSLSGISPYAHIPFGIEFAISAVSGEIAIYSYLGIGANAPPNTRFSGSIYGGAIFNLYNAGNYWGSAVTVNVSMGRWGGGFAFGSDWINGPYGVTASYSPFNKGLSGSAALVNYPRSKYTTHVTKLSHQLWIMPYMFTASTAFTAIASKGKAGVKGSLLGGVYGSLASGIWAQTKWLSPKDLQHQQNSTRPDGWQGGSLF